VTVEQAPAAAGRRSRNRLVVQGVLSLVLVAAIFYYLLTKIDLAQVWAAITAMTWLELATLGLLALWNLCTYAFVWMAVTSPAKVDRWAATGRQVGAAVRAAGCVLVQPGRAGPTGPVHYRTPSSAPSAWGAGWDAIDDRRPGDVPRRPSDHTSPLAGR
jgi:hypothetical protein